MADKFLNLTGLSHFLSKIQALIDEKASSYSPKLLFRIGSTTDLPGNPHVELRETGNSPARGMGVVIYDSVGNSTIVDLVNSAGNRNFATVGEVNAKAPIDSPVFTTAAFAPNPSTSVDSTRIATTHYTNEMFDAFETPTTIYNSGGVTLRKFGRLIVATFNSVASIPSKSTIDSAAGGESWLPSMPITQFYCLWDYGNKRQVYLTISSSGMTAVRTVDQTTVTSYRLYGTVAWITS